MPRKSSHVHNQPHTRSHPIALLYEARALSKRKQNEKQRRAAPPFVFAGVQWSGVGSDHNGLPAPIRR